MSALSLQNLSFNYGAKAALKDISLTVERGEFCALLGPNGAGKSTLFSLLTRLRLPAQGRIEITGHDLARAPLQALSRMGIVFQQPTLDLDLSVRRNMMYFAGLHGLRGAKARTRIDAALDRLNMVQRADEKVRDLNGGHRRRMEIARALVHQPEILLLDEPTVGLDVEARQSITDHVHELVSDGLCVLWATHLVDEVRPGDRVVILHRGEIKADSTARALSKDQSLLERFLELTGDGVAA